MGMFIFWYMTIGAWATFTYVLDGFLRDYTADENTVGDNIICVLFLVFLTLVWPIAVLATAYDKSVILKQKAKERRHDLEE